MEFHDGMTIYQKWYRTMLEECITETARLLNEPVEEIREASKLMVDHSSELPKISDLATNEEPLVLAMIINLRASWKKFIEMGKQLQEFQECEPQRFDAEFDLLDENKQMFTLLALEANREGIM